MASSLPVLTFHALDDRPSVISFPRRLFGRGMRRLHDSGYRTVNFPELVKYLEATIHFQNVHSSLHSLGLVMSGFSGQHSKVAHALHRAMRIYRPKAYPGRLTLFRARMQPLFSSHKPDKGWGRLAAGGLDIRIVPGNHLGMFQEPHVKTLAEELRACLDKSAASTIEVR